ncbi:MAG TPA: HAD family hydrolase [Candidatus Choladousia intestinipullorum]|nr:HAD family hydrolase [Candidatus Choladousia intestinipullorum]
MIRYIIFDMDGVLVNTEPMHFAVWKQLFQERGVSLEYDCYKGCIGSTGEYLCGLIYETYGRDFRGDSSIMKRFREIKNKVISSDGIPRIDGVPETVALLHRKGFHLAVASSSPQEYIEFCMKELAISQYFDVLFSGERVPNPKPAPDVFLETARRLHADPQECLVIEDSRNGCTAAKAAGMSCLGFQNPDSGIQDLSSADRIFYPFSELIEAAGL